MPYLPFAAISEPISQLSRSEHTQHDDIASRRVVASIWRNAVKDYVALHEPLAYSRMIADSITARKARQFLQSGLYGTQLSLRGPARARLKQPLSDADEISPRRRC
jgi:hypothetical protein